MKKLPPEEQEALAAILLQELAAEQRRTESLAKSQYALEKLAECGFDNAAQATKV